MTSLLFFTAITLGLLILLKHLMGLIAPLPFKKFLQHFPRSRFLGTALLSLAGIWTFILAATIDLGEFSPMRHFILLGIVISAGLFWWLVPDFLAVRSLGFILLLAAHPLLEMTFLKSGFLPILLSLLAYAWVIAGLFFVGMPYLLRNLITTITAPNRHRLWNLLCWLGILYGVTLIVAGVWFLME